MCWNAISYHSSLFLVETSLLFLSTVDWTFVIVVVGRTLFTAFIQLLANNSETVVRHLLLNCSVTSVVVFSQLPLPALCQMDSSSSILLQKTLHCNVLFCQTLIIATIANDCNQKALLFRYYELFFQCCARILQIYVQVNTYNLANINKKIVSFSRPSQFTHFGSQQWKVQHFLFVFHTTDIEI